MEDAASLDSYLFYRHRRPELEPPEAPTPAPTSEAYVLAKDGYRLAASIFDPPDGPVRPGRVAVVASATGVRRTYYARFAAWLATRGSRVVTFDYRGIGGSRPERLTSFDASLVDWGALDLASVVKWVATELGDGRTSLVGHSVGGQLVGLLPDPALLRSVVMVGSQSGDYRLWPGVADRARLGALWYAVIPGVTSMLGYLPGSLGIGEDLPGGVAREWARWCRTPGYVVGGDGVARREGYRQLRAPVLAFGFDDDDYAPPAAVDALLALYENADVTRRQVSRREARVGHFGFFRERFRPTFWKEAARFLEQTSA
jgi:predicted alpha/beta hydrolase